MSNPKIENARTEVRRLEDKLSHGRSLSVNEKHRFERARATIRAHILKRVALVCGGIAATGGLTIAMSSSPPHPQKRIQPTSPHISTSVNPPPHPALDISKIMVLQQERQGRSIRALEKFKDTNDKTKQLFDMFQQHGVPAVLLGRDDFVILTQDPTRLNDPYHFLTIYSVPEYSARTEEAAPAVWSGNDKALKIDTDIINSDEWLGIFLNHELSHAFDFYFGGETKDKSAWEAGEVRAHELECALIERMDPTAYRKLITEGMPMWRERNLDGIYKIGGELFFQSKSSPVQQSLVSAALLTCVSFKDAEQRDLNKASVYRNELLPLNTVHP